MGALGDLMDARERLVRILSHTRRIPHQKYEGEERSAGATLADRSSILVECQDR